MWCAGCEEVRCAGCEEGTYSKYLEEDLEEMEEETLGPELTC